MPTEDQTIKHLKEFNRRIERLQVADNIPNLFAGNRMGLERETLRIDPMGNISQLNHPSALGSALTHSQVTTDYSEALLELITKPLSGPEASIREMELLHKFVLGNLGDELTWASSMPCVLDGENSIRIAEYGSSNAGQMKTIYRRGLGLRYGRLMQVIAGVHFNFSLSEEFWQLLKEIEGDDRDMQAFKSDLYFGQLRNLQRMGWIVLYLFGASPAVCESFFGVNEPIGLEYFGNHTYYQSYATSLRMGDIGYQNKKEGKTGVHIVYDNLETYVRSLESSISTQCSNYAAMGVEKDGIYQQLNANRLQIENEYYSSVRPKAIVDGMEKPVRALQRAGVEYVELRSVDVNPFEPTGLDAQQLRFLEAFMVFAMLKDSPLISDDEAEINDANASRVAHRGREPGLTLRRCGYEVPLVQWGRDILERMFAVCELLDAKLDKPLYSEALSAQYEKLSNPELTPSARVLRELTENQESFYAFSLRYSKEHQAYYDKLKVEQEGLDALAKKAAETHELQRQMEAVEEVSFKQFIDDYMAQ